jgi:hypothetical protein
MSPEAKDGKLLWGVLSQSLYSLVQAQQSSQFYVLLGNPFFCAPTDSGALALYPIPCASQSHRISPDMPTDMPTDPSPLNPSQSALNPDTIRNDLQRGTPH